MSPLSVDGLGKKGQSAKPRGDFATGPQVLFRLDWPAISRIWKGKPSAFNHPTPASGTIKLSSASTVIRIRMAKPLSACAHAASESNRTFANFITQTHYAFPSACQTIFSDGLPRFRHPAKVVERLRILLPCGLRGI